MTRWFFYHALGVGLAGRITRPFCDVIDAQAATALGIMGGHASSRVDEYRFRDVVSLRSAHAYAVGSEAEDGSFNTSVAVTVEGLNILDAITAESITARLSSRHRMDDDEPTISAVGTEFRGLRIGGHPVDPEIDRELFCRARTYGDVKAQLTRRTAAKGELTEGRPESWRESRGMMVGSIVRPLPGELGALETRGYSIRVPTVGRIFLGEVLVSGYARRLTMIRVELGSPVGGSLELASSEVNGSTYP